MKVQCLVVTLLAALVLAYALPANKKEDKDIQKDVNKEVDFVPLGEKNFGPFPPGVIDVDAGSFFDNKPFGHNPFTSTYNGFEAAFTRMRQLLNQLLGQTPTEPDFPELHIPNFGNIDLGKGNTTSITKVINGHKITINDTEYKSDEGNGSSFFKVHVVEVHPDTVDSSTKQDVEPLSSPKPESELVEESLSNEIPKIKDNEGSKLDENIETFDEADLMHDQQFTNQQWNKVSDVQNLEDNRIDAAPPKPYDLSRDTYVNELLADSGAPTNPDAEVFEPIGGKVPSGSYYSEIRAEPSRVAPFGFYPNTMYEQYRMQPFTNPAFYAPSMGLVSNNQYYNRLQPEQIMIVPFNSNLQSYLVPLPIQTTSNLAQGINPNEVIPSVTAGIAAQHKTAPSTT